MLKKLFRLLFGVVVCIFPHAQGQHDCYNILKPREWHGEEDTFCLWDNNCRTCPSEGDSDYGSDILPFYEDYFVNHTDIPGQVCKLKLAEGYLPHCRYFGFFVQCDVHYCNEHAGCYNMETNGSDYMGIARFTESGYSCLTWSDVDHGFNETEIELKENFCQNPDGSERPWCFYADQNDSVGRDYCPVPACATNVLSDFTRIPDTYPLNPMTMTSYHNLGLLVPDVEEQCAQMCVEEENFECRSFFVGPSGFCLVSGAGAIHDGEQIEHLKDSGGDLFYRKSTRCNEVIPHKYPDHCMLPLGLEGKWIEDEQISVTSAIDEDHGASNARLNSPHSWIPDTTDYQPAITITFYERTIVSGIVLQTGSHIGHSENLVSNFTIDFDPRPDYASDPQIPYAGEDTYPKVLPGMFYSDCPQPVFLDPPVWTYGLRIKPLSNSTEPFSLRLEILGCQDNDCDSEFGFMRGEVDGVQVLDLDDTGDSEFRLAALRAFEYQGPGWIPGSPEAWVQMAVTEPFQLSAMIFRKCVNPDSRTDAFRLWFSTNETIEAGHLNLTETFYVDYQNTSLARVDFPEPFELLELVRFYPVNTSSVTCVRLELVGCNFSSCNKRLGMESREIQRSQLTCKGCNETTINQSRLHHFDPKGFTGCVLPTTEVHDIWFQIAFKDVHVFHAIMSQGGFVEGRRTFIARLKVEYKLLDQDSWREYKNIIGETMYFENARDPYTVSTHHFERAFFTRTVRVSPSPDSEMTKPGVLRLELVGCRLDYAAKLCGDKEFVHEGFCYGVVDEEGPMACDKIFIPGSHPANIKSSSIQSFITSKSETLLHDKADRFVIGLEREVGEEFEWTDGTPLDYSNLVPTTSVGNQRNKMCVYMDAYDCFQWKTYDCNPQRRAVICQYDINECLSSHHGCSYQCRNTPGSYYCLCQPGFRRDATNDCIDICSTTNASAVNLTRDAGLCIGHTIGENSNWNEANQRCRMLNKHLPGDRMVIGHHALITYLQKQAANISSWPFIWLQNKTTGVNPLCHVANLTNGVQIIQVPCNRMYSFLCVTEYEVLNLDDLWEANKMSNEWSPIEQVITSSYGFIEFFGYAPWFGTDKAKNTTIKIITTRANTSIRLTFHHILLRQSEDACIDKLEINLGASRGNWSLICGEVEEELVLIPNGNMVEMLIRLGEIQSDMINEIGFSLTYEAIDCTYETCSTGCGIGTTLIASDDMIQTSPFPSQFQPYSYCFYDITPPSDDNRTLYVVLEFVEYRMKRNGRFCEDSVTLEGTSSFSPSDTERVFHCDVTTPLQVTSWNWMRVTVKTGLQSISEGFIAMYRFSEKPGCSVGNILDPGPAGRSVFEVECREPSGVLASVNYPSYDSAANSWAITTGRDTYIVVNNIILELKESESHVQSKIEPDRCRSFLRISEKNDLGDMEETEYCPIIHPMKAELETRKNRLDISMHLDVGDRGKFYAEYQSRHFPGVTDKSQSGYICQEGWDRYLNFCYQMISAETKVTWHEAEEACQDKGEGSHLVSIKGTGAMDFVHHKLTSDWLLEEEYNWVYIGLKRVDDEGKFRWSDGSPMSFTSWYRSTSDEIHSQPDGSELEECTMIMMTRINSVAQWHDVTCSRPSTRHYICKQPAVNNVTGEVFHTDNHTVVYNKPDEDTTCPPSLYMCTDGEYFIQRIFVCDGIDHCYDGSDELDCKAHNDDDECPKDFFRCTEGECISTSFLCDNINHCEDNSDELGCHYAPCREDEVPCAFDPYICIASTKMCDLIKDCPDGTDETDCDEESSLFPCYSGRMLPNSALCDGTVDCIGSSYEDELKCDYNEPNYTCDPETELQCDNGKCVDLSTKCLYDVDRLGFIIGCRDVSHLRDCSDFVCPPYTFGCPLSYCIPLRMRCNGIKDCPNGQDELECDQDQYKCPNSSYACQQLSGDVIEGQRICLAPDQICDGQTQCPQGDDELYCDFTCPINCTCFGLSVTCERPSWKSHNPPVLHRDVRILRISDVPLVLEPTDEGTLYQNDNRTESNEDEPISISLTNLPYLAELELTSTGIKRLTPGIFLNNTNLYKMNLSGNELDDIVAGALFPLKSLRNLDITHTSVDAGPKNKDLFMGVNNTLTELHVDNFVFCCLLDSNVHCHTEKDRFSSCDNLLNNELLRILMWVLGISALIGNTFVVSYRILQRKRVENSQVQSHLISNLAVSDLMMGVYMMIIAATDETYRGQYYLHSESWRSSVLCKTAGFLSMLSSEVSVFLVMIISLDRLFCVVFPFRQRLHLTPQKALVLIVATWIFSFLLSLVPLLVPDYAGHFYGQSSVCLAIPLTPETEPGWEYSVFIFLGINFFSFMVTLICYVVIFAEVYMSSARMAGRKQQTSHSRRLNGQIKLASKMALIVGTDFCCWMPVIIMGILAKTGAAEIPADMYAWSAVVLLPINSAINPYLYTLSSLQQRRKQRLRTKALATNMSMQDVNTKTEISIDDNLDNSTSEEPCQVKINPLYASLAKHCILTPFTHFGRTTHIQTLTEYINQRGTMPSMVDSALIRRDISKALSYLKSKGVVDMEPGEEKIAVQLSSGGDVRQAFFVVYNAKDVQRLLQPGSKSSNLNNHLSDQREYVKTMLEDLREKDENLKPKDDNLKASKVGY